MRKGESLLNMKKITAYLSVIFIIFILSACGKKELPDTYVEGSDYQYMQMGGFAFHLPIQKGTDGYYFQKGSYLYYLDGTTDTLLPLCGKADCLHDKEPDQEQLTKCNAYIGDHIVGGISFCNGNVYYMEKVAGSSYVYTLYRISSDGVKKEQLYQWKMDGLISEWIIHRDVLYYTEQEYLLEDGKISTQYHVNMLPLTGMIRQPEQIYTADDGLEVFALGILSAYGNYFYFQILAYTEDFEEITDENYSDYLYQKYFIYDTRDRQLTELAINEMTEDYMIGRIIFWQDKILFTPTGLKTEYMEPEPWYIADLDGSNAEVCFENIGMGLSFISDGNYLYLSNANMVDRGYVTEEKTYTVFDQNLETVDSFTLPFEYFSDPPIGDAEYMYIMYENESGWGVLRWDKSGIGSYNGNSFETTEIPYE